MSKIFYTSDLHFGHENIIRRCNRPFKSVSEMNETLIKNWNSKVSDDDTVYILGDFFYRGDIETFKDIMTRLKGKKRIIIGNHDKFLKGVNWRNYFESLDRYLEIVDNGRMVCLFHYPIEEWKGYYRKSYMLYGHVHENMCNIKEHERKFNVGVDVNEFMPMTLDEMIERNK